MSHRKYHAQSGGGGVNGIETIVHENFEKKKIIQPYILYIMITFKPVNRRGAKEGGEVVYHYPRTILHSFLFVIFFFMQKSCGQFVDVSDLNLVVCYLI